MNNSELKTQNSKLNPSSRQGNLLGLLTAAFYVLFTLLPDSNSAMVEWSWVLFWQVGLLCPVLWMLGMLWQQRLHWLGNHLDKVVGLLVVGVVISATLARFPMQARWYGWAVLCFVAALYALSSWLEYPKRRINLLTAQGWLNLAFILVSLLLWFSQVYLPQLAQLQEFRQFGVNLPFDFSSIELRNGSPIGHQNYVAGYLVLALPLLVGLGILQKGWRRWLWLGGAGLGLLDLYTTSSRSGWLGAALLAIAGIILLLWQSKLPRRWVGAISLSGLAVLVVLVLANNRLRSLFAGLFTGQGGGEVAYRLITVTTGWKMGLSHLLTGIGPGNVPLLYQKYRPAWAGREAELHYQLHSTPAQLWAELGLWSVLTAMGAIALLAFLSFRWFRSLLAQPIPSSQTPPVLIGSILLSLLAYALVSLTDYQLDNIPISGTIVIYLAVLVSEFRGQEAEGRGQRAEGRGQRAEGGGQEIENSASSSLVSDAETLSSNEPPSSPSSPSPLPSPTLNSQLLTLNSLFPLAGLGLVLAITLWLVPIHRAWMLSNQGFTALSRDDINTFAQRLTQANQLAPWEPYYPNQLGWNLGNSGLQVKDSKQQQVFFQDGATWLQRGIEASPDQEFGHTNLAWLQLSRDPKAASQSFARSVQLVPAKRGVLYGLGLSLLAQGKRELAIAALTLETLRDPELITSPVWKLPDLQPLYAPVVAQMEAQYTALLKQKHSQTLSYQLRQSRGGLRWWLGNLAEARADLGTDAPLLNQMVLDLAAGKNVEPALSQVQSSAGGLAIAAWLNSNKREDLLRQAWITATKTLPPEDVLKQLVETMGRSQSFDQWLKQNAPTRQYRRERAGFGVLSRHADGPAPVDFLTVIENIPLTQFFNEMLPSYVFAPELDNVLQPAREALVSIVLDPLHK